MEYLKIADYAVRVGKSERTIRDWISKKKIDYTHKTIDGRKIQVIEVNNNINELRQSAAIDAEYEEIAATDAAIEYEDIAASNETSLITFEKDTFTQLIDSIKDLADDRKIADQKTIENLYAEVYELRAQVKAQNEEIKQMIRDSALIETELNIKKIEVEELKKSNTWFKKL